MRIEWIMIAGASSIPLIILFGFIMRLSQKDVEYYQQKYNNVIHSNSVLRCQIETFKHAICANMMCKDRCMMEVSEAEEVEVERA